MIAALPLSVSAAGEYVPGNPRWSGYQNQVQWDRPAGAASGDSFEYEAQLLLGDDVVESKAVEIDTYLFFTNDVVTRPQEEYTIRVRARWIMIVGDPDGQYMVADVGEAEPPHEHSYTQKHDAAQHWQACSCGERLNVAKHSYGDWKVIKEATETEEGSRERDCTVCDYVQTEIIPMLEHEHSYGDWQKDETQHWKECRCGEKTEVGNHTFGDWTISGIQSGNGNRTAGYKGDRECRQSGERQLECGNGTDACIHSDGGRGGSGQIRGLSGAVDRQRRQEYHQRGVFQQRDIGR